MHWLDCQFVPLTPHVSRLEISVQTLSACMQGMSEGSGCSRLWLRLQQRNKDRSLREVGKVAQSLGDEESRGAVKPCTKASTVELTPRPKTLGKFIPLSSQWSGWKICRLNKHWSAAGKVTLQSLVFL